MRAKRLFLAGLIMEGVFAAGHLAGFAQAAVAARQNPAMAELTRAMRAYKASVLGLHPSILDFREYFSLNFSILLGCAAASGFVALSLAREEAVAIRRLSTLHLIAMLLLLATSVFFSVPQGIVSTLLITALFALAWRSAAGGGRLAEQSAGIRTSEG